MAKQKRARAGYWVARVAIAAASFLIAVLLTAVAVAEEDLPHLVAGTVVTGDITATDPEVHTPTLDDPKSYGGSGKLTRGKTYTVEVTETGVYRIELRSYLFDAYLVLRDVEGKVIAEDDDALIGTQARIVCELATGGTYRVDACALREGTGPLELSLLSGVPAKLTRKERQDLELSEAMRTVEEQERVLGADSERLATSLNALGMLYYRRGEHSLCERAFTRALAIREKVLGAEHPNVATSLNNLATLLEAQVKYGEARPLYERALAIKEKVLGLEHPSVARSLNNLGLLLVRQGEYDEARRLYDRALAIREKVLGAEHPNVATSLHNLAMLLQEEGKYDEARRLYERALAIREKVLGAEHPNVARSLSNLAVLLEALGKYDEARRLYERALTIKEKALGPEHPSVATSLNNLAVLLAGQGEYDEARRLYERAQAI
ncbi:MAG: tetratricopeptide repeat protein, partial [Planctomycetota bacterium]